MKAKVTVPAIGDPRFKRWTKTLTHVDVSKSNGYAFEGEFARRDYLVEVPTGTTYLCYGERGSTKHNYPVVMLKRVSSDGTLEIIYGKDNLNPAWALQVRDEIAALVNDQPAVNPLADFTDEQIVDEARRRNLI